MPVHFTAHRFALADTAPSIRPSFPLEPDYQYIKVALSGWPRRIFVIVVGVVDGSGSSGLSVGLDAAKVQRETCVVLLSMSEGEGRNGL